MAGGKLVDITSWRWSCGCCV